MLIVSYLVKSNELHLQGLWAVGYDEDLIKAPQEASGVTE